MLLTPMSFIGRGHLRWSPSEWCLHISILNINLQTLIWCSTLIEIKECDFLVMQSMPQVILWYQHIWLQIKKFLLHEQYNIIELVQIQLRLCTFSKDIYKQDIYPSSREFHSFGNNTYPEHVHVLNRKQKWLIFKIKMYLY